MATPQGEIVRRLDGGFAVAWDTTDVSDEVREEFRDAVDHHIDLIVQVLDDDGGEYVAAIEFKSTGSPTDTTVAKADEQAATFARRARTNRLQRSPKRPR
jgi:hypothetical protein